MSKNEYLAELKSRLMSLPSDERDAAVKYYEEFFEDAGEGKEQDVIAELGSPKALADSIIGETKRTEKSSTEYIPANITEDTKQKDSNDNNKKASNTNTALIVIILILLSPVIIPIAASIFSVLVGILAAIFGIWIGCGAVVLAMAIGGIALLIGGLCIMFVTPLEGLLVSGIGLILLSIGLFLLIPFVLICSKLIPSIVRGFVDLCSRIFRRNKVTA